VLRFDESPRFALTAIRLPFGEGDVIQKKQVEERNDYEQAENGSKSSFPENLPVRDDQQRKEKKGNDDQMRWSE
jgi:hypothetical protein